MSHQKGKVKEVCIPGWHESLLAPFDFRSLERLASYVGSKVLPEFIQIEALAAGVDELAKADPDAEKLLKTLFLIKVTNLVVNSS